MFKRVVTAAVFAALSAPVGAATITNGGFESPGTFSGSFTNTSTLVGWSVSGNVDLINTLWEASESDYSLDLNGSASSATISQTITDLIVGTVYDIFFDLSGNPDGPPPEKEVSVTAGGTTGDFSFNTDTVGNTRADMRWETNSLRFTANDTSTLLSFSSTQSPTSFGPALDNIRIEAVSPVPLPAAGWMLLAGVGGIAAMRRRKRA